MQKIICREKITCEKNVKNHKKEAKMGKRCLKKSFLYTVITAIMVVFISLQPVTVYASTHKEDEFPEDEWDDEKREIAWNVLGNTQWNHESWAFNADGVITLDGIADTTYIGSIREAVHGTLQYLEASGRNGKYPATDYESLILYMCLYFYSKAEAADSSLTCQYEVEDSSGAVIPYLAALGGSEKVKISQSSTSFGYYLYNSEYDICFYRLFINPKTTIGKIYSRRLPETEEIIVYSPSVRKLFDDIVEAEIALDNTEEGESPDLYNTSSLCGLINYVIYHSQYEEGIISESQFKKLTSELPSDEEERINLYEELSDTYRGLDENTYYIELDNPHRRRTDGSINEDEPDRIRITYPQWNKVWPDKAAINPLEEFHIYVEGEYDDYVKFERNYVAVRVLEGYNHDLFE